MSFLCLILFCASVAEAVTPDQVLKSAWTEKTYMALDEVQSTSSKNPFKAVEVSFTDEREDSKSSFETEVKFQFKSYPEWKIGNGHENQKNLLKASSLGWALKNRYSVILQYELNRRKLERVAEALRLSDGYLKAQNLSLRAGKATSKNYLSAQNELYKLKRYQSGLQQEQSQLEKKLKTWVKETDSSGLTSYNLVSVEEIGQVLQTNPTESESLSKKLSDQEIKLMSEELAIVKGRERQWVKSFDVAHVSKDEEDQYKIGVTFQIPTLGHDVLAKQKQNDLLLKRALKQKEAEEAGDQLQNLKVQILNLIELYKNESKLSELKVGSLDPLANIERKIAMEQEQIDLLNKHQEICYLYLDYLLESELLVKNPEKNYLEKSLQAAL
ncbi:hypothetical protein [Bdellovibrio reynosensis]|uniref:TolC family protein n=1 Tax=Bdellovibrio reynosensis TaxID=2835041 RepID=A0ABY4C7L3_9BACT|nr:hypothetical protein [Bdellovibrio reynosensis]UOF00982.1 hypothetical protein MNR06_14870 [Bdellovibrio reynosensis]